MGGGIAVPVNELVGEELQEKLAMVKQLNVAVVPEASKKLVATFFKETLECQRNREQ